MTAPSIASPATAPEGIFDGFSVEELVFDEPEMLGELETVEETMARGIAP